MNQASPYAYAADDPINNTDPTGEGIWQDVANVAIGVTAIAATTAICGATGLVTCAIAGGIIGAAATSGTTAINGGTTSDILIAGAVGGAAGAIGSPVGQYLSDNWAAYWYNGTHG